MKNKVPNRSWLIALPLFAFGLFYLTLLSFSGIPAFRPAASAASMPVSISNLKEALKERPEKGFKACLDFYTETGDVIRTRDLSFCERAYPRLTADYDVSRQEELKLLKYQ